MDGDLNIINDLRILADWTHCRKRRRRRIFENHIEHAGQGSKFKQNGHGLDKIRRPPSKRRKLDDSSDTTETSSDSSDESSDDSSLFSVSDSSDESTNSESDISSSFDINDYKDGDENESNEVNENAEEDGMICIVKSEPYDDPLANNAIDDEDIKPDINELNKSLNRESFESNHITIKHEPAII